jgi:hypothetical protein
MPRFDANYIKLFSRPSTVCILHDDILTGPQLLFAWPRSAPCQHEEGNLAPASKIALRRFEDVFSLVHGCHAFLVWGLQR